MSRPPSRPDSITIQRPSGDQLGTPLKCGPRVSRVSRPERTSITKVWNTPASSRSEWNTGADLVWEPGSCAAARAQLEEYFRGERRTFELDLAPAGTAFQRRVWEALRRIPYGRTASYGEIARELGMPGASRAVGQANNRNPLPIVVPCHRVIGADTSVTGFGGGIAIKRALLDFERGQASLFPA